MSDENDVESDVRVILESQYVFAIMPFGPVVNAAAAAARMLSAPWSIKDEINLATWRHANNPVLM